MPTVILDKLIQRLDAFSSVFGEIELIDVIGKLDPNKLIQLHNHKNLFNWIPDIRVALANVLAKAELDQEQKNIALLLLETLTQDNIFAVRRAAYRAISVLDQDHLYSLCYSWINSEVDKVSLKGADACGWIRDYRTKERNDGFMDVYLVARGHRNGRVRKAARQSWDTRRKRIWAMDYLTRVLNVRTNNNEEILQNWRYGEALANIGDDECQVVLREHCIKQTLPPNVKFWINSIVEKMNSNWKKETQKWPEPWTDMSGVLKMGKGKFENMHDSPVDIQYTVWFSPASVPGEKYSWGGVLVIPSLAEFLDLPSGNLITENGSIGKIILTRLQGNSVTFRVNGPITL